MQNCGTERAQELIAALRSQCLRRGLGGIKGLGVMFRRMDSDFSRRLSYRELKLGVSNYGLDITDSDLRILYDAIDTDKSGSIDFCEFIEQLRPPLSIKRKAVISEAFQKLDVNGDGAISVEDLKEIYSDNAKQHPKYRSGQWTLDETLRNFLDGLDTPGQADGKVTLEEFINFYSGVSSTIDDDMYFDLMMRSSYNLHKHRASLAN